MEVQSVTMALIPPILMYSYSLTVFIIEMERPRTCLRWTSATIHRDDGRQALLNGVGCSCCGGRRCRDRTWP
jgi:hypothetical protein